MQLRAADASSPRRTRSSRSSRSSRRTAPGSRMSIHGSFLSDDQFLCSICLDVFTNPSSIPCGHTFCMSCITRYWDQCELFQCPLCKKSFPKRPILHVNRTLREITEQFKSMRGGVPVGNGKEDQTLRKGHRGGSGHLMEELKKKMHKKHQDKHKIKGEHHTSTRFPPITNPQPSSVPDRISAAPPPPRQISPSNPRRRYTLSGAACSQNIPVCPIHQRGILMYCRTDQVCICPECEIEDHNDHDTVTVEAEWMETKPKLQGSEQEIQEMIRERTRKIEEIKMSMTEVEMAVERETASSVCMFSMLTSAIERSQAELIEVMEISRRAAEQQADSMIKQLEREIEELQIRDRALGELAQSDDHLHCVKTFQTLSSPPPSKDWSGVSLNCDLGTSAVYRTLATMVKKFQEELQKVTESGFPGPLIEPVPVQALPRVKRMQEYALDVTLDSHTAHPRLVLSEDLKIVWCGDRHQHMAENPERFDRVVCVLGQQPISSGKHYWEVEVGGKTDWDLGVARQSISRKGKINYTPQNGFWFLSLRDKSKYAFRTEPSTDVNLNLRPHKIGIFVDYEKGQVSFYNVDAKVHIYTFNDNFTENIYPFFSPCTNKGGRNDMPLIITPIVLTE
ncbi:E3 ubiquitin-protein ligase TRIM39 [Oryzias latipes]|uniref:E3 ubiquitin-protein ligase TRIM39 n=1 Tax=Oryzias latipes TaxID=8090 RepID=UPI0009D9A880|nr:E3 ubiquitin-protein ligase TRIM39 [Oryzias latipes]